MNKIAKKKVNLYLSSSLLIVTNVSSFDPKFKLFIQNMPKTPNDLLHSILHHHYHHHPTQYISHIKKLWTGFGEGKTAATHTHRKERDQRSSPAREKYGDVHTRKKRPIKEKSRATYKIKGNKKTKKETRGAGWQEPTRTSVI